MRGVGGVRKSIHQSWLAKGFGLLCWGFKGVQEEIPSEEVQHSSNRVSGISTRTMHQSTTVTDYLTKMGIKTDPHPPYSPDLAPCVLWLFPKLRGCRYETIEEMKEAVTKVIYTLTEGDWYSHTRVLQWGLPEVVGTVQQMHCSWRRLLRRGLEFHECTINKSADTKKVWELI